MEELFLWTGTALRVLLAGAVALLPGTAVWLTVLGIALSVRQLTHSNLSRRQRQKSAVTPDPVPN